MSQVVPAVLTLLVIGVLFAVCLGIAAKAFAVEEDYRIPLVRECLPGANCGGCGFPGCDGLAAAIAKGEAPVSACPVGGAACAEKIANALGREVATEARKVAHIYCGGGCNAADRAAYEGIPDCTAAMRIFGGQKACAYGCLGFGTCVRSCGFDAIRMENEVAVVDKEKCVACGKCIASCPKKLIHFVAADCKVHVNCQNTDRGPDVMKVCSAGCIGCGMCEKTCRFDAIHVVDGIAKIDYDSCKNCKMCAKVCPKHCIEPIPETNTMAVS